MPQRELPLWQRVWRHAIYPQLDLGELEALYAGLEKNDPAILQGRTVEPDPIKPNLREEPTGCCPVAYAIWKGPDRPGITVDEVEELFSSICARCDHAIGEPRCVRHFLNWWDESDRKQARIDLLTEVSINLLARRTDPFPPRPSNYRSAA